MAPNPLHPLTRMDTISVVSILFSKNLSKFIPLDNFHIYLIGMTSLLIDRNSKLSPLTMVLKYTRLFQHIVRFKQLALLPKETPFSPSSLTHFISELVLIFRPRAVVFAEHPAGDLAWFPTQVGTNRRGRRKIFRSRKFILFPKKQLPEDTEKLKANLYLILFAPHAFVFQSQVRPSLLPSPLVFRTISTDFTPTPFVPQASSAL
ncbi:MAG: hypothetical protein HYT12_00725 [Candidatus Liptonbacteria bacterium]|nr:hypothetical protein [Candidatus Liptonbacteria bacterium]